MKTSASNRRLRVLLTALSDKTLDPRPEFQRRLVWSNKDKVQFIKTVLEGYPFPEIYIASGHVETDTGRGIEMLVDGQQRMTTLHQYFMGSDDLRLGTLVPDYKALTDDQKLEFLEYEVVVRDLGKLELSEIKTIFEKINSTSYGLNAMEIRNSRYAGAFKDFCEELATDDFFERYRVFSAAEIRRMQDVRYCIVLVATMLSGYFNRDNDVETFLELYSESFPKKEAVNSKIKSAFSLIEELGFTPDARIFKKADLFTAVVEYCKLNDDEVTGLNINTASQRLAEFYKHVDSDPDSPEYTGDAAIYHKASLQATNDRS
ncbi:MAG TPA: DUF262 domain-containing protein, partial [Candidatus Obscuribacterales bacterium]